MLRLTILLTLALSIFPLHVAAGELIPAVTTERGSYSVGDIISLKVELEGSGFKLAAADEEEMAPFEIEGSDEQYDGKSGITTLTMRGRIFEPGEFSIPSLTILKEDGSSIKTGEFTLIIKPVLKGDEKDIRPLKPQLVLDESGPFWPWLLTALLLALIIALIFYLKGRKKETGEEEEAVEVVPPHIEALEEIKRIEAMNLVREGRLKEHYTLVSDVVRVFEGKSRGFDAMEMTTGELISSIRGSGANANEREDTSPLLEKFLSDCDMVKFAKFRPADMDIMDLTKRAREIINKGTGPDITPETGKERVEDRMESAEEGDKPHAP